MSGSRITLPCPKTAPEAPFNFLHVRVVSEICFETDIANSVPAIAYHRLQDGLTRITQCQLLAKRYVSRGPNQRVKRPGVLHVELAEIEEYTLCSGCHDR